MNEQLVELYSRIMNKPIDSKTLSYWMNGVRSGALSIDGIKKNLIASDDYKNRVETMFKQVYFELVGFEKFEVVFSKFWSVVNDEVSYKQIDEFIKSSQEYLERLEAMVTSSFAYAGKEYDTTILNFYIEQLRQGKLTTLEQLQNSINLLLHCDTTKSAVLCCPVDIKIEQRFEKPQIFNLQDDKVEAFEQVFERPMFVEEYFKYIVKNPSVFDNVQELYSLYRKIYIQTITIVRDFSRQEMSEWDFIKKYLSEIDSHDFIKTLIHQLIKTDCYQKAMKDMILIWYKKLYDSVLNSDDLQYLFNIMSDKQIHLNDEKLVEEIKQFKMETDEYVENIFGTYTRVLQRQPDIYEIDQYICYYRHHKNIEKSVVEIYLENLLVNTLEFHEIIKQTIKAAYSEKYPTKDIPPSKLYIKLQEITSKLSTKSNLLDINTWISSLDY